MLDQHSLCTPLENFENGDAHVDGPITSGPFMLLNEFPPLERESRRRYLSLFAGGIKKASDLTSEQQASSL